MLGAVDSENPIDHHPLPTIVLNTETDQLVDHNDAAIRLLGTAALEVPFSQLLLSDHGRLVVFLDAVEYYGSYIDRTISLAGPDHNALRLQTYGVQCPSNRVLLSFLDLDEHERRDRQTDQDAQQRAGLTKWQSIYGFFREVEAQNHLILEAAGEGIYGINAKGQATFVNRAAQEMLGWSADDLIGTWDVALYFSVDSPPSATVMEIGSAGADGTLTGSFYASAFEVGRYTVREGAVVISVITSDGSGPYATSGRLVAPGQVEGQTLSTGRGFLMAWTATKR